MKDPVTHFLLKHHDPCRPLLLALSGGPDSLALLHMLLHYRTSHPLDLAIAHVDHGWRPESGHEATILEKIAAEYNLPFHLKKLNPSTLKGNLESACRTERLRFFKELCDLYGYQAVLTGHHADDLSETVLKRLFEGARLTHLSGLQEVSDFEGLALWRPLLTVEKEEIINWLNDRGIKSFQDSTNSDKRFLRARMRQTLIPYLNEQFGKRIAPSLLNLSSEATALRDYLSDRLKLYMDAVIEGKWGYLIDLTSLPPLHPYELREFIRFFSEKVGFLLSRELVELTASLLEDHSANKRVVSGTKTLEIDRGRLFFPQIKLPPFPIIKLSEGKHHLGPWSVIVSRQKEPLSANYQGWQAAWQGRCAVTLPEADYTLAPISPGTSYRDHTAIDKYWTNHKVPAFLRPLFPGIWKEDSLIHEFLTDKNHALFTETPLVHILITFAGDRG